MTKATKDPFQQSVEMAVPPLANQQAFASMAHLGFDSMRRALEINAQFFRFVSGRLAEDARLADALSHCRSPQDAVSTMTQFYQSAFASWSDEIRVLNERAAEAAAEAVHAVEIEAKAAVESPDRS